tara:strand:+ start:14788 stop:14934 length:147 start_codon:yes stop_codon:yes gene_type:complete
MFDYPQIEKILRRNCTLNAFIVNRLPMMGVVNYRRLGVRADYNNCVSG